MTGTTGNNNEDQDQAPPNAPPPNVPPPLIETAAQFVANFVPPDYLVDELLQRSFLYGLTGMTGHGKTAVALPWAILIAHGLPIDGKEVEKGKVLFLAGENP